MSRLLLIPISCCVLVTACQRGADDSPRPGSLLDQSTWPQEVTTMGGETGITFSLKPDTPFVKHAYYLKYTKPVEAEIVQFSDVKVGETDVRIALPDVSQAVREGDWIVLRGDHKNFSTEFRWSADRDGVHWTLKIDTDSEVTGIPEDERRHHTGVARRVNAKPEPDSRFKKSVEVTAWIISPAWRGEDTWYEPTATLTVSGDKTADDINVLAEQITTVAATASAPYSPFFVTNPRFNGHIFWDSDVWMFPTLAMLAPKRASITAAYRYNQASSSAKQHYKRWIDNGLPIAEGNHHLPDADLARLFRKDLHPALIPWETTRDLQEGSPSDTVFQHHINGDVAWMLDQSWALGLSDAWMIESTIWDLAAFYAMRMDKDASGKYGLSHVVSPSEWHTVSDDLYTNLIADWTLRRALGEDLWPHGQVRMPRDNVTYLTFPGDKLRQYQQSAALLTLFPLQHPEVEKEATAMLDRFVGKSADEGPAMSHGLDALLLARYDNADRALQSLKKSIDLYTRNPLVEFREKPGGESTFLTGMCASVNAVLYGFLGLRIDEEPLPDAQWSRQMTSGRWITCRPNLPKAWEKIRLENCQIDGETYTFTATHQGLTVVRVPDPPKPPER